jgi:diguanylate cyclase (GGDEF)-like protein
LCESLIDKRELRMADELLTALRKTELVKNTLGGRSILSDMRVSYAMARKRTDLLREAYQAQHETHQELIREQKRVYQYTGELLRLVSELRNEQETMQREHEVLLRLAKTDALTGLANREALTDRLEQAFETAWHNKSLLGICMIDVDELKKVNDTYGHTEGDRLLAEFGTVLAAYAADIGAFAGRYGGDEFVIIYENKTDAAIRAGAGRLAKRSPLRISQGICNVVPTDYVRPWDLLRLADSAMYAAKKRARTDARASGISFNNRIRIPE